MILKPVLLWYCFRFASTTQKAFVWVLVTAFSTHKTPPCHTRKASSFSPLAHCVRGNSEWASEMWSFGLFRHTLTEKIYGNFLIRKLTSPTLETNSCDWLKVLTWPNNAHFLRDTNWEKFAFDSTALSGYGEISYKIASFPSSTNSTWWREEVTQSALPKSSRISMEEEKSGWKFGVFTARQEKNLI